MPFEIHETEIDGVPTLWVDGAGPLTAILGFRVGVADEPMPQRGVTHLVEHLALGPLGVTEYEHNGTVEGARTIFVAAGSNDEVVAFMDHVTRSLADLPTDRILHERAVLRRESAEQGGAIGGLLRGYRFGAGGHGGVADEEHGVGWLGPEPVRRWADGRFGRENAVLVINRAPPPGLRLHLADGPLWPVPPAREPSWLALPSYLAWPHSGVALTYTMNRTSSATIAAHVLHRRARGALRVEDGSVYDVAFDTEPLDTSMAHVLYGTDTAESNVAAVTGRLIGVHDQLVAGGPTVEEIATEVNSLRRDFEHPDARFAYADRLGFDRLLGLPLRTPDELLAQRAAVRPEEVRAALADGGTRMMVASSAENPAPDRFQPYPMTSASKVDGEAVSPAGFRLPGMGPRERLIVGRDGFAIRAGGTDMAVVRYDELVMVEHTAGARNVVAADGSRIEIVGKAWRGGQQILEAIDTRAAPELVACDEHSPGALADPDGRS
jgi:zinc protease